MLGCGEILLSRLCEAANFWRLQVTSPLCGGRASSPHFPRTSGNRLLRLGNEKRISPAWRNSDAGVQALPLACTSSEDLETHSVETDRAPSPPLPRLSHQSSLTPCGTRAHGIFSACDRPRGHLLPGCNRESPRSLRSVSL